MLSRYGKWVLITGASSGIGEEFAKRLASEKYNLIIIARREERLKALAELLKEKEGIEVKVIPGDLTDLNFIDRIKKECVGLEVGLLINNAGFGSTGEFINCDSEREGRMVLLNCVAPTLLTHHFLTGMVERKKGGIIFLGSTVAFQSTPMMATYSATKAFNLHLGEALWYELKKYKIDVLALNPGGTNTEFQRIASVGTGPKPRTPQQVVETALNALGKKPGVIDGALNKTMAVMGKFLPRKSLVFAAGKIAEKIYKAEGNKN
jgi:uncharacterized protein